jgi:hypothetical protein
LLPLPPPLPLPPWWQWQRTKVSDRDYPFRINDSQSYIEWPQTCTERGVLKISLSTRENHPLYVLEGRLAGLWAKELIRVTSQLGPGTTSVFDLENVYYVDSLGENTLLWLNRLGATFIAENVYGKDLCRRLHLRRSTETKPSASNQIRQNAGKSPSIPSS